MSEKKGFKLILEDLEKKPGKLFSKGDFAHLLSALLNEEEYEMVYVKGVDKDTNEPITATSKPVKKFRDMLVKLLVKAKIDRTDAEAIVSAYNFSKADGDVLYEIFNEILDQYLRAGKTFKALPREDYELKLVMTDEEEKITSGTMKGRKDRNTGAALPDIEWESKCKKHKKVRALSGCPDHLKVKIK